MSSSLFHTYTDAAKFHVKPTELKCKYIGGTAWTITSSTEPTGSSQWTRYKLKVCCSQPFDFIASFKAEISFTRCQRAVGTNPSSAVLCSHSVKVDRDGWSIALVDGIGLPDKANFFNGYDLTIKVFCSDSNPQSLVEDVILLIGTKMIPASSIKTFVQDCPCDGNRKIRVDRWVPISAVAFKQFVSVMMKRNMSIVTKDSVMAIRALALRFDVDALLAHCGQFLIGTDGFTPFEKLKIADQWKDERIIDHLTGTFALMLGQYSRDTQKRIIVKTAAKL